MSDKAITTLEALLKLQESMKLPTYVESVKEQLNRLVEILIEKEKGNDD